MNQKKVTIYTTPTCHFCKEVKEFFKENKVKYIEKDVTKDRAALKEMIEKSGSTGVPVIVIDDKWKDAIIGFNEPKLRKILNIS